MKTKIKHPVPVSQTIQNKSKAANQAPVGKILQRYQDKTIQRQDIDEDELIQGKFDDTTQLMEPDEDEEIPLQGKFEDTTQREEGNSSSPAPVSPINKTGLPDDLKTGIENLSGYSMDDVRVHYNSGKPAQLQALAYTQGTDIHVAPGQEKHLPHEAWHVVQQKQGRVQPTMQLQGVNVNDNEGLEKEADVMGATVFQMKNTATYLPQIPSDMARHHIIPDTLLKSVFKKAKEKALDSKHFKFYDQIKTLAIDQYEKRFNAESKINNDEITNISQSLIKKPYNPKNEIEKITKINFNPEQLDEDDIEELFIWSPGNLVIGPKEDRLLDPGNTLDIEAMELAGKNTKNTFTLYKLLHKYLDEESEESDNLDTIINLLKEHIGSPIVKTDKIKDFATKSQITTAKKLDIPVEVVRKAYKSDWEFKRKTITALPLKNRLNREQFGELRVNFNLPSLGKLYTTYEKYSKLTGRYEYMKEKRERENNNVESK